MAHDMLSLYSWGFPATACRRHQPSPCGNLMMFERTFLYCLMNMVPLVELHTLSQTNMQMDKGALEDVLPVRMVDFPLPCFLVNVYIHHYNPS